MAEVITRLNPSTTELTRLIRDGWEVALTREVQITLLHPDYIRGHGMATQIILRRQNPVPSRIRHVLPIETPLGPSHP